MKLHTPKKKTPSTSSSSPSSFSLFIRIFFLYLGNSAGFTHCLFLFCFKFFSHFGFTCCCMQCGGREIWEGECEVLPCLFSYALARCAQYCFLAGIYPGSPFHNKALSYQNFNYSISLPLPLFPSKIQTFISSSTRLHTVS